MYHIVLTRYQRGNQYSQIVTTKTECKLLCSGRVISSCSTRVICRVTLVTNPVFRHEWWKDREELATSGTYLWSFVTEICRNGLHSDYFNLTKGNPWCSSFLVTSNPLSRNPDRNHMSWQLLTISQYQTYILLFTMESYPTPSFVLVVLYAVSTMLPMSLDCPFFNAPSVFFLTFN